MINTHYMSSLLLLTHLILRKPNETGTVVIFIFQMRKLQSKRLKNTPKTAHLLNRRVKIHLRSAGPRVDGPYPNLPGNQNSLFRESLLPLFHNFMYLFFSNLRFLEVEN